MVEDALVAHAALRAIELQDVRQLDVLALDAAIKAAQDIAHVIEDLAFALRVCLLVDVHDATRAAQFVDARPRPRLDVNQIPDFEHTRTESCALSSISSACMRRYVMIVVRLHRSIHARACSWSARH